MYTRPLTRMVPSTRGSFTPRRTGTYSTLFKPILKSTARRLQRTGIERPSKLYLAGAAGAAIAHQAQKAINWYYGGPKKSKTHAKSDRGKKAIGPTNIRSNKKQIQRLKQMTDNDTGTHVFRIRYTGRLLAGVNESQHMQQFGCDALALENALTNLKYYNPSVPGTLTTASGASGTFSHKFLFQTIHTQFKIRNNYQSPCKVTVYIVTPKNDTSKAPLTTFTDGLADIGSPTSTSPLVFITDSLVFKNLYKIEKSITKVLDAGKSCKMSYTIKDLLYDTSYFDAHTSSYKKIEGAHAYIVRLEGVLGHDTTLDEQGYLAAGIDWEAENKFVIKYNAGIDLYQVEITDNADTFTNGGVVSSKPVADNQGYSVA